MCIHDLAMFGRSWKDLRCVVSNGRYATWSGRISACTTHHLRRFTQLYPSSMTLFTTKKIYICQALTTCNEQSKCRSESIFPDYRSNTHMKIWVHSTTNLQHQPRRPIPTPPNHLETLASKCITQSPSQFSASLSSSSSASPQST